MLLDTLIYKVSSLLAGLSSFQSHFQPQDTTMDSLQPQTQPELQVETPFVAHVPSEFTAEHGLLLSDLLTRENSLSIFYSYARETNVGRLFETEGAGVTVFAPTNKAIMALPRKPYVTFPSCCLLFLSFFFLS